MNVTTYPEMNEKIVGILRISDDPMCQYAAQRIEELEQEVAKLKKEEAESEGRKFLNDIICYGGLASAT